MKKTKRFIALLTALVLVFSTMISSVSFAAVNKDVVGTDYEVAVAKLKAVGIMEGYPDGTFAPNGEITRAEFAKIAVVAMGLGDAAKASEGVTKFPDVTGTHWASGYVNLAANRGLVSGYPDGTYKPENKMRNSEAITILCRMVGLGPVVDKEGTWPANYVGRAANEGILDDVNVASGTNATRGNVAVMLANTLSVELWGADGYGNDGSVDYGQLDTTLLADKLNVDELKEETVTGYEVDDRELTVEGDVNDTFEVPEGSDIDLYNAFMNEVTIWVNDDDEIIFMDITSDFFIDAIEMSGPADDEVTLIGADKTYDMSDSLIANLADQTNLNDAGTVAQVADLKYDLAKVVLNDKNEVEYIDAYEFTDFVVVESVKEDVVTDIDDEELDLDDYTIFKNGMLIDATAMVKGDVLLFSSADDFAEVYTKSVTGAIQTVFDDAFEVKDVEYEYAAGLVDDVQSMYIDEDGDYSVFDDEGADQMQEEGDVTIFVDREGEALFVTGKLGAVSTNTVGGILTGDVTFDDSFGKNSLELVFVNQLGKKVTEVVKLKDLDEITFDGTTYEVDEPVDTAGANIDFFELNGADEIIAYDDQAVDVDLFAAVGGGITDLGDVTGPVDTWLRENVMVTFTYNADGDVVGLEFYSANAETLAVADIDSSKDSYAEGEKLTSSTLVFDISDGVDAGDTVITKWSDVKFDISKDSGNTVVYSNSDNEIVYIVTDDTTVDDTTDFVGLLVSYRENTDNEITRLTAWVNGAEKTYTVDKETSSLTTGTAYTLVVNDETGVVSNVTTLNDANPLLDKTLDGLTININAVSVSDRTFKVGATTYKLVSGATIVDITDGEDEGEVLAIRDLEDLGSGNVVTIILDEANTNFVKMVIVTTNDN